MTSQGFRSAFDFGVKRNTLNWFPKHMNSGLLQMQAKLRSIDCLIEVHDARIPFSGRNSDFAQKIIGNKPQLLILNKADLIIRKDRQKILDYFQDKERIIFTNCKHDKDQGLRDISSTMVKLILGSERFDRANKQEFNAMVIGVPNVGKSTLINMLRARNLKKARALKVGPSAGVTKTVHEKVKISENPVIFLFDTPGILTPRISNLDSGLKIAVCGNLPDNQVGETVIADYLLFILNKKGYQKEYMKMLGLNEPSDCVLTILTKGAIHLKMVNETYDITNSSYISKPNILQVAQHFILAFRTGKLGKIIIDDFPSPEEYFGERKAFLDLDKENDNDNQSIINQLK